MLHDALSVTFHYCGLSRHAHQRRTAECDVEVLICQVFHVIGLADAPSIGPRQFLATTVENSRYEVIVQLRETGKPLFQIEIPEHWVLFV